MTKYQPRHAADVRDIGRRLLVRGGAAATVIGAATLGLPGAAQAALPMLRYGSRGSAVVTLQKKLRTLGYSVSTDGIFGPNVLRNVKAFQRSAKLGVDGIVGPNTWAALDRATSGGSEPDPKPEPSDPKPDPTPDPQPTGSRPMLRPGSRGSHVTYLQRQLSSHGFWVGSIDGSYGHLTSQAVMCLQKTYGLGRDGICGPNTWSAVGRISRPRAAYYSGNGIEIDLRRQVLRVVEGGRVKWAFNTSTGTSRTPTPRGTYRNFRRVNKMDYSPLGKLWRPVYFYRGYAIHGSTSIPGYPASHGCARVSNAAMDYIWARNLAPIGRSVRVY